MVKRWVALEANPEVLTKFAAKLGLDTNKLSFHDVYGLDPELLAMVPQPVQALLLLYPITPGVQQSMATEEKNLRATGAGVPPGAFFMKQTIGNACGTIAVLHAVGNVQEQAGIEEDSFFGRFFRATAEMNPAERGAYLEKPPLGEASIDAAHEAIAAAQEGDTPPTEDTDIHFVTLLNYHGRLVELDGRKAAPIDHGPTTPESLLQDAVAVAKQFMSATESLNFTLIAFSATPK